MNPNARKTLGIQRYDSTATLQTQDDMQQYFQECLQAGDPALAQHALGVIARARGMVQRPKTPA
jgi:probable addiction module antidote protein